MQVGLAGFLASDVRFVNKTAEISTLAEDLLSEMVVWKRIRGAFGHDLI